MSIARIPLLSRLGKLRKVKASHFMWLLFAFFLALSLLVHSPVVLRYDREVTLELQEERNIYFDALALGSTFLGNTLTLIGLGIVAFLFLSMRGKRVAGMLAAASVASVALNYGMKFVVGRPRPTEGVVDIVLPAVGLSFPSGHAMGAVAFYGFLAVLVYIHVTQHVWRFTGTVLLAGLTLAIGFSRIYLGAHWFSDVVGGWTAGVLIIALLTHLYRKWGARELPGFETTAQST